MRPLVLIAGCGNIGRRHVEALARTRAEPRLHIVEPDAAAREAARAAGGELEATLSADWSGAPPEAALAVVATPAGVRPAALAALLAASRPRTVLLEKVLCQKVGDLATMGEALTLAGAGGFVNCGRRGFPGYQALREEIARERREAPVSIAVEGAGWRMGSNAVHFLDLAEFLAGEPLAALKAADLAVEEARHSGCIELSGRLEGRLSGGGTIAIACAAGPVRAPVVTVTAGDARWRVEEAAGRLLREGAPAAAFETRHVSEMPEVYDALIEGRPALTPYADSARQHALMLAAFNAALGQPEDATCPVS